MRRMGFGTYFNYLAPQEYSGSLGQAAPPKDSQFLGPGGDPNADPTGLGLLDILGFGDEQKAIKAIEDEIARLKTIADQAAAAAVQTKKPADAAAATTAQVNLVNFQAAAAAVKAAAAAAKKKKTNLWPWALGVAGFALLGWGLWKMKQPKRRRRRR